MPIHSEGIRTASKQATKYKKLYQVTCKSILSAPCMMSDLTEQSQMQRNSRERMIMFHPREKKRFPYKWKPPNGGRHNKNPGREMPQKMMCTPPSPGISSFRGDRATPRSPSSTVAPFLSPGAPRPTAWGGRGAVARPRGGAVALERAGTLRGILKSTWF